MQENPGAVSFGLNLIIGNDYGRIDFSESTKG